ncbi:MAG: Jag N-terminal domain-containing protein [Ruminococcus sp.]|nr:Jag N-terminal domain-containing protein [Ruminococcus sp.]
MTEIFTAKTVEEAKKLAAAKFGRNINEIKFEVVEEAKKGLFGLGAKDARVKATYVEKVRKEKSDVQPEKTVKVVEKVPEKIEEPAEETFEEIIEEVPEEVQETTEEPVEIPEEKPVEEVIEEVPAVKEEPIDIPEEKAEIPAEIEDVPEDDNEYSTENLTLIEDKALMHEKVKLAIDYITSMLRAMNVEAEFTVYQNEKSAVIDIKSANNGTIIGRRGETLDSMQYLCSIIANKGDKDYFRITLDCLNYRQKRRETLEQLAVKVSKSVLRTGRSQPLEPMNPYERRVIHSAISKIDGVSSHSVGEEPYRKIIITSDNPRRNNRNNRNNGKKRYDGQKNERRQNNRPKNHEKGNFERKKVDISTSFEKDYKRPKPEDAIEGGLYGKIEI